MARVVPGRSAGRPADEPARRIVSEFRSLSPYLPLCAILDISLKEALRFFYFFGRGARNMDFASCVKSHGGKAKSWGQRFFVDRNPGIFDPQGVCASLVARWIKDTKLGVNFQKDMWTTYGVAEVEQLEVNKGKDSREFVAKYLENAGLKRLNEYGFKGGLKFDHIVVTATQAAGYSFVGISSKGVEKSPKGHALGVHVPNKTGTPYLLFDPNFGQAEFTTVDPLKKLFKEMLCTVYSKYTGTALVERFI